MPRLFPHWVDLPRRHPVSVLTPAASGPFIRVVSTVLFSSYQFLCNLHNISNMGKNVTLFDDPGVDATKAPIENVLELTPVVDIGPVQQVHPIPRIQKNKLTTHSTGCFHQYPPPLAPPRSPRHLRRRRYSPVPLRSHANRPLRFRRPQHALLLRASR